MESSKASDRDDVFINFSIGGNLGIYSEEEPKPLLEKNRVLPLKQPLAFAAGSDRLGLALPISPLGKVKKWLYLKSCFVLTLSLSTDPSSRGQY